MNVQGENAWSIEGSRNDVETALCQAEQRLKPLPDKTVFGLLGELDLMTARLNKGAFDKEAQFRLYARELRSYPGDVVADVLQSWRGSFFPTLVELRKGIEGHRTMTSHTCKISALREYLS